jgi:hypothetical protein
MAEMRKTGAMKRTTIMLPEALHRRAASRARQRGISLGELVRDSLDTALPGLSYEEDPLFEDVIFDGPAPGNLSANHDEYLYEKK